ncbi:hypothetical protein AMAG_18415 [Allomyces macrogynus ATCC 38327]|uniref:Uncharacterized protein n=1 Tax=Allomyces macrogynus (strain ATCC 38327) TaxID=578462 RepID=A0A0L0SBH4_ALLM3|nr:hypothetical protein AMAG_18415 [Allomyces macrogynus ATCC 38327]|eukprot:KNE59745.1 hypothetical protein AMAG_18415 [Allomyces macrogynus ATCC 38327]
MSDATTTTALVKPIPSKQVFAKWAVVATVANAAVDMTAADLSSLRSLVMVRMLCGQALALFPPPA